MYLNNVERIRLPFSDVSDVFPPLQQVNHFSDARQKTYQPQHKQRIYYLNPECYGAWRCLVEPHPVELEPVDMDRMVQSGIQVVPWFNDPVRQDWFEKSDIFFHIFREYFHGSLLLVYVPLTRNTRMPVNTHHMLLCKKAEWESDVKWVLFIILWGLYLRGSAFLVTQLI